MVEMGGKLGVGKEAEGILEKFSWSLFRPASSIWMGEETGLISGIEMDVESAFFFNNSNPACAFAPLASIPEFCRSADLSIDTRNAERDRRRPPMGGD